MLHARDPKFKGKYKAIEVRRLIAQMRSLLAVGKSDLQVSEEMGLGTKDYNALKREMYEQDKLDLTEKSIEEVFTDYTIKQEGCIKDLQDLIDDMKAKKNYNAMIGAVRAKSDIVDKVIEKGQSFGLIEKAPDRKQVVAGILVGKLDINGLRALVAKSTAETDQLLKKFGDHHILEEAEMGPRALPAKSATVTVEATPAAALEDTGPKFTATNKPKMAMGGLAKAAGPKVAQQNRNAGKKVQAG